MASLFKLFDQKPKLNRAQTTSALDEKTKKTPKQSNVLKSHSQTNVVNGIYRTVKPSRSKTRQEFNGDNSLRAYKSSDNKMFVSPAQSNQSTLNTQLHDPDNDLIGNNVDERIGSVSNDVVYYRRFSSSEDELEMQNKSPDNHFEDCNEEDYEGGEDDGILIDILPSFQFYDSLVKFLPQDRNEIDAPSLSNNENDIDFVDSNSGQESNPPEYNRTLSPSTSIIQNQMPVPSFSSLSTGDTSLDRFEVDKFYKLPHKVSNNIEIKVVLTKHPVEPNTISEKENLLREFSSGELINGYVTVMNRSPNPLKFEGFYVSFEGSTNMKNRDEKNTTTMRFLKTHDLSATWSYAQVELASGVNYDSTVVDTTDNTKLGLPNSKILKPKKKYKKYFCFKVPKEILDSNCKHQIPQHLALPPSYGLNRDNPNNAFIDMNYMLGYGHTGLKGSALLCPDLASYDDYVADYLKKNMKGVKSSGKLKNGFTNEGSSINYSVSCKLIIKEEGAPMPYVLNDTVYNIRVIPNTLSSNSKYRYTDGKSSLVNVKEVKKKLLGINNTIVKRIDLLETLLQKLEHWKDLDNFIKDDLLQQTQDMSEKKQDQEQSKIGALEQKKEGFPSHQSLGACGLKGSIMQQDADEMGYNDSYKKTFQLNSDSKKQTTHSFDKINALFGTNSSNTPTSSNNSLSGNINNTSSKITFEARLNRDLKALPYHRSKYIASHNIIENKNKTDKKVWMNEVIPQLPQPSLDYEFTSVPLTITVENNITTKPELKSLKFKLHSYTAYTKRSSPILFDAHLVQTEEKILDQIIVNSQQSVKAIEKLKKSYAKYQDKLKFLAKKLEVKERSIKFESFISANLFSDLEALASLKIEQFEISNVFKPPVIPPANVLKWQPISNDKMKCDLEVNLKYKEDLMLTILPTFSSCLISRFYHLDVQCEFVSGDIAVLKIPVDVKHFK